MTTKAFEELEEDLKKEHSRDDEGVTTPLLHEYDTPPAQLEAGGVPVAKTTPGLYDRASQFCSDHERSIVDGASALIGLGAGLGVPELVESWLGVPVSNGVKALCTGLGFFAGIIGAEGGRALANADLDPARGCSASKYNNRR
jgi:hypothetical protein